MDKYVSACPFGTRPYVIEIGDTLFRISEKFDTTIEIIKNLNPGLQEDSIRIGAIICVPVNVGRCNGIIYTIEAGDTLYKIAKKFGVRVLDIIKVNPYIDVYNLRIGGKLCIPKLKEHKKEIERFYITKEGDTLIMILRKYNLCLKDLIEVNPCIDFTKKIRPGVRLYIPIKEKNNYIEKEYIINENETLEEIAEKYNISVDMLLLINQNLKLTDFKKGVKIRLPKCMK